MMADRRKPRPARMSVEGLRWCSRHQGYVAPDAFMRSTRYADGLDGWCAECRKAYQRQRYAANVEQERARSLAYQQRRRQAQGFPPPFAKALVWWRNNHTERLCSACMVYMDPSCFRTAKPGPYGKGRREDNWLARVCRVCEREGHRAYYRANREQMIRTALDWQKAHKGRVRLIRRRAARVKRLRERLAMEAARLERIERAG